MPQDEERLARRGSGADMAPGLILQECGHRGQALRTTHADRVEVQRADGKARLRAWTSEAMVLTGTWDDDDQCWHAARPGHSARASDPDHWVRSEHVYVHRRDNGLLSIRYNEDERHGVEYMNAPSVTIRATNAMGNRLAATAPATPAAAVPAAVLPLWDQGATLEVRMPRLAKNPQDEERLARRAGRSERPRRRKGETLTWDDDEADPDVGADDWRETVTMVVRTMKEVMDHAGGHGTWAHGWSNVGWRARTGSRLTDDPPEEVFSRVLPRSAPSRWTVKDEGDHLAVTVWHHDAPTGEKHVLRPATEAERATLAEPTATLAEPTEENPQDEERLARRAGQTSSRGPCGTFSVGRSRDMHHLQVAGAEAQVTVYDGAGRAWKLPVTSRQVIVAGHNTDLQVDCGSERLFTAKTLTLSRGTASSWPELRRAIGPEMPGWPAEDWLLLEGRDIHGNRLLTKAVLTGGGRSALAWRTGTAEGVSRNWSGHAYTIMARPSPGSSPNPQDEERLARRSVPPAGPQPLRLRPAEEAAMDAFVGASCDAARRLLPWAEHVRDAVRRTTQDAGNRSGFGHQPINLLAVAAVAAWARAYGAGAVEDDLLRVAALPWVAPREVDDTTARLESDADALGYVGDAARSRAALLTAARHALASLVPHQLPWARRPHGDGVIVALTYVRDSSARAGYLVDDLVKAVVPVWRDVMLSQRRRPPV